MLVLSRQRDESVMIGDDIEVKVIDIQGDKVRLGFSAPREVPVNRREIHDAIRNRKAYLDGVEAALAASGTHTKEAGK